MRPAPSPPAGPRVPVRVTATLLTPMLARETPPLLDGVLAWAAVQADIQADVPADPPSDAPSDAADPYAAQDRLPLAAVVSPSGAWVWQASACCPWPLAEPELHTRYHRLDLHALLADEARGLVTLPTLTTDQPHAYQGQYKGVIARDPMRPTLAAVAWAIADPEAVRALLARVTHLGGARRYDAGRVLAWDVAPDPDAAALWAVRPLPSDLDRTVEQAAARAVAQRFGGDPASTPGGATSSATSTGTGSGAVPMLAYAPDVGQLHPPYWHRGDERRLRRPVAYPEWPAPPRTPPARPSARGRAVPPSPSAS